MEYRDIPKDMDLQNGSNLELQASLQTSLEEYVDEDLLIHRPAIKALITTFLTAFILFTTTGNLMTLFVLKKDKRLRSVSNMYLASLAAADVVVGSFVMTFMMLYTITYEGHWIFGKSFCHIWTFVDYVCCTASLTNVCLIARDRYVTVSAPLRAIRKRTKKRAMYNIVVAWTIPLIFWATTISVLAIMENYEEDKPATTKITCSVHWNPTFVVLIASVSMTYIPIGIILVLFIAMMLFLRRHMQSMNLGMEPLADQSYRRKSVRQQSFVSLASEDATSEKGGISFNPRYSVEVACPLIDHTSRKASSVVSSSVVFSNTSTESTETISTRSSLSGDILNRDGDLSSAAAARRVFSSNRTVSVATSTSPERYGIVRSVATNTSPSLTSNPSKASITSDITDMRISGLRRKFRRLRSDSRFESDVDSSDNELIQVKPKNNRSQSLKADMTSQTCTHYSFDQSHLPWNRYASVLRANRQNSVEKSRVKQQVSAARTLGVIMGFLLLCWIPFSVMCPLVAYCPDCLSHDVYNISIWINYMNSAINPIIYCLCNPQFRKAYIQLINRK